VDKLDMWVSSLIGVEFHYMNRERYKKVIDFVYNFASWLHLGIFIIILISLCVGIFGFINKWLLILNDPPFVLNEFHQIAQDIFSLILVFEIMELLRQRNPLRLTDILLTVIARKMLLSPEESSLIFLQSISFCLVLVCRMAWKRISNE
jgi:hypothetical protein